LRPGDNALDQLRQPLVRAAHLIDVAVAVVGAFDAADGVT
jgi:hypothetical protein